ncbi:MAG: DUF1549 domain-containing protein [Planctomycetes bacterium]|nr:DUF1549 domain-containing protein [Planctomycetota bacterium]
MSLRTPCLIALACWLGCGPLAAVEVTAAAARIDAVIEADCSHHGVALSREAPDAVFLRRVYLDIIGRIPTVDEATRFLSDSHSDRRHLLIEKLIASDGYVHAQYGFWADLLRLQTQLMGRYTGEPYIDWVKQAIRADMPYDQFVTALITAQGPALAAGNGATGFYLRDAGMPQDNMSNTIQVFLGTRVACAQCHNHPFDTWTRMQYLQMAAYTNSVKEQADPAFVDALKKLANAEGKPSKDEADAMRKWTDTVAQAVSDGGKDTIALPKDYQYPDGKPGKTVKAHALIGSITTKSGQKPRDAYAAWLTSPDNPRFSVVIANRLWKRVMGLGAIEPLDNFTDATVAANPALMDELAGLMKDVDYDLRKFQEILYHTRTYQRIATAAPILEPGEYRFPGPVLRRLSAEQVWDSLLTLVVPDLDKRKLSDAAAMYAYYEEMSHRSPADLWQQIKTVAAKLQERLEVGDRMYALEKTGDKDAVHKTPGFQQLRDQAQSLDRVIRDLSFDRLKGAQVPESDERWKGFRRDLVRASEVSSPAPPGHFLRDFGQSDRLLIDNSNRNAAVTQALTLLNGFVDQEVLQPKTVLMRTVATVEDPAAKLRVLFLAILTREPTDADRKPFAGWEAATAPDPKLTGKAAAAAQAKQVDQLVRGVAWTLINSREFMFER